MCSKAGVDFSALLPELLVRIATFLPPNDVACNLRLVNKAIANIVCDWKQVRLSQLVPHQAFVQRWGHERSTRDQTLQRRQQLLALVAGSGSLLNLEVALAAAGCTPGSIVANAAAEAGHVHICEWLHARGYLRYRCPAIKSAARSGRAAVVRWVLQREPEPHARNALLLEALAEAATGGYQTLCEELLAAAPEGVQRRAWLIAIRDSAGAGHGELALNLLERAEPPDTSDGSLIGCASYGLDLPTLKRLYASLQTACGTASSHSLADRLKEYGSRIAYAAVTSPTDDWRAKLEWLEGPEGPGCRLQSTPGIDDCFPNVTFTHICERADALERIAVLRQREVLSAETMLDSAVRSGRLSVLRHLLSPEDGGGLRGQLHGGLSRLAVTAGSLEMLAELLAAGCPIEPLTVFCAANHGHLHVLQWLASPQSGPMAAEALQTMLGTSALLMFAGLSGNLELVRWLRDERGCPWDGETFTAAAQSGNAALMEWLVAQGCPMPGLGQPFLKACRNDDLATLRCLRRLGCPWGNTFAEAVWPCGGDSVEACSATVLQWLVAEGCPVDLRESRV